MPNSRLLDLPREILVRIIQFTITARAWPFGDNNEERPTGVPRALALRLICRDFDVLFQHALFGTHLLDIYCSKMRYKETRILLYWPTRRNYGAQQIWHSHMVYRVKNETDPSVHGYIGIRQIATLVSNVLQAALASQNLSLDDTIDSLCWLALEEDLAGRHRYTNGRSRDGPLTSIHPETNLLSAAAYLDCLPLAKKLLQEGADPTSRGGLFPAAIEAAAWQKHVDILQLFQESLPDYVEPDESFTVHPTVPYRFKGKADPQAIVGAARSGDVDILQMALYPPSRTDPESTNYFGYAHGEINPLSDVGSFILAAMLHAKSWAVYSMLASFFRPRAFELSKTGSTYRAAMHLRAFAEFGNLEIVQGLLDTGVDMDWNEPYGLRGPLHEACRHGYEDIVDLLIQRGANVNRVCGSHSTPLFQAVLGGFLGIARKLLDNGATCDVLCAEAALDRDHTAMAELLLSKIPNEELIKEFDWLNDLATSSTTPVRSSFRAKYTGHPQ